MEERETDERNRAIYPSTQAQSSEDHQALAALGFGSRVDAADVVPGNGRPSALEG